MIDARVLAMRPHPDQATNNPGCWAVQIRVSHAGESRTFWRWHGCTQRNEKPSADEILAHFWRETFLELHGFNFESFEKIFTDA